MSARLLAPALAFTVVLALAGCGKPGAPVVPGSNFPRPYPNPQLSPTQTAEPPPEDQPGMEGGNKAKFTSTGSYIDPAVRDTELRRGQVGAGSTLPFTQTTDPNNNTPFNHQLGIPGGSPLGSPTGMTPQDDNEPTTPPPTPVPTPQNTEQTPQ